MLKCLFFHGGGRGCCFVLFLSFCYLFLLLFFFRFKMETNDEKVLKRCLGYLGEHLDPSVVFNGLIEKNILTFEEVELIKEERGRQAKVRTLVDNLIRKGPSAYKAFKESLVEAKLHSIHTFLVKRERTGSGNMSSDEQKEVPEEVPEQVAAGTEGTLQHFAHQSC